ncbi:MAG: hypothetical protein K8S18_14470, partial [Desulfobacula sp.]|nr:hypothetical protein [Desulfobacula sp.]
MFSFDKIHSINRMQLSEKYQKDFPDRFNQRVLKDLFRFPFVTLWYLLTGLINFTGFPRRHKIVFFYQTKNNYNTIKSIQKITSDSILLSTKPNSWGRGYLLPTGIAYILSFVFLPLALYHLFKSQGNQKKAFRAQFDTYLKTYGLIIAHELYIRFISPQAMVLTNDHSRDPLIISNICKMKNIPVFFIPHGSFSGEILKENPMHFDFAFVAGEDQKKKIEKVIPASKIYLIGRPISDSCYFKQNRFDKVTRVGVCISLLYDASNLKKIIDIIAEKTNLQIIIRPHPSLQNLKVIKSMIDSKTVCFSNPVTETPIDFLTKVDAIVTGCSGIHLDAAEMNVYPIFYDFSQCYNDFNNFVKNGLVKYASTPEECVQFLKELSIVKPDIRILAKYYNGIIGTKYDGSSSLL